MNVSNRHPGAFAAVGLIAAFAFAVILAVAILGDSSWVYGESMLSDLGVSDVELSADLFNYGCIVVGILLIVFGIGKALCETGANRAGGFFIAFAGLFLALVGHFTTDYGNTHEAIAIILSLFLFVAMVITAVADWRDDYRLNSALSTIMILVIMGCAVGMNVESLELIAVACAVVWVAGLSAKMIFMSATRKGVSA